MSQTALDELKNESKAENQTIEANNDPDLEDKWMIRECELYKDEYKECTSFKGRFHQYFIYGESQDCNQWKKDYDNCCKWVDDNDIKAAQILIKSEKHRRLERLKPHYRNDIWTKREKPPEDWAKPLPEWMLERDKHTYLAQKAKEIQEGKIEEDKNSFCSIM